MFLHGILGRWRNFRAISQAFQESHAVLLYDQRGHGQSLYQKPYSIHRLAVDLKELLSNLHWDKASLVGHSLGGYVALAFSALYPQCVEKTVIVDSSPWPLKEQGEKISQLIKNLPDRFANTDTVREFFKKAVERGDFSQTMADFLRGALQKSADKPIQFLFDKQNLPELIADVRQEDWPALIKKQQSPGLILRGERSAHFLKSDFERAGLLNPLFQIKEIKNSGHWIHADQPQAFIQTAQGFLY